ncbi:hypothetical protein C5167_050455 [Papaver somniferum]|uniref:Uncharacterized protein n=1 Tax=Papaver somniferum TaxID=3469 RepID=A0A4Y7KQ70_PAPSO|nr:hypothetical protein C5167_050455 [Papaver somniferum]
MIASGLMANTSGLLSYSNPKLPIRHQTQRFKISEFDGFKRAPIPSHQVSGLRVLNSPVLRRNQMKCAVSSGANHQGFQDEFRSDPYWLTLIKEAIWGVRSLVLFLVEQPGQLRYIEWPSFQNTMDVANREGFLNNIEVPDGQDELKTATLTLVLVALLIVALASIDSVLCFLLALLLRKTA